MNRSLFEPLTIERARTVDVPFAGMAAILALSAACFASSFRKAEHAAGSLPPDSSAQKVELGKSQAALTETVKLGGSALLAGALSLVSIRRKKN